uniref:2-dehydropantoate 2-reductase n=1 Tax=Pyramimonas obovata TaxID=1411642 RepID=A0A7S0R713_9CHLO|mmetsp:Transcript_27316/g.59688  ORF Transcript_27316/g.59688 Transcript_27316/m.59688 type:complete len:322 (+) Transcript_27316:58-1023(+)|eukprot:CAMPEP_0118940922 /NCGR_PEP_ID=MMETSP1169-20130426/32652_1 /TAXON_ID=36882 /ORGANISM="Pyramimonas obovata, Strain CCMP722" /LENGTH=321 /DNA_ID=CAMNT_0006885551 /DNA_START=43 /DNA_END=1008 /DNA_ORIENTATION=-
MSGYRVCVYGAGGVGGYLAARLAQNGVDVTVIARGEHLRAIREKGLFLTSVAGDYHASVKATDNTSEVGIVDLIIICCKSWQVPDIAMTLPPMIGEHTVVVPTQNGVEAPEQLANVVGGERVFGGYIRIMALIQAAGHVVHNGVPQAEFGVGILPGVGRGEQQLERMREAFCGTVGLFLKIEADIRMRMWWKLIYIGSVSGVCAAARATFGEVCTCQQAAALLKAVATEMFSVAEASGVVFPSGEAERIAHQHSELGKNTPNNTPSMMRDFDKGGPSEVENQLGTVVRYAARHALKVPNVAALYAILLVQERKHRLAHHVM